MRKTFADLVRLMTTNPKAYALEIERMRVQDPDRLERFVDHYRRELARTAQEDDRPLDDAEVEELWANIGATLGWTKRRVMAEAALRLLDAISDRDFAAVTTSEQKPARSYMRRRSSIQALVLRNIASVLDQRSK